MLLTNHCVSSLHAGVEPYPGYHLLERLGAGNFGEVWSAQAPDGPRIALKFMPCRDSWAVGREIRALQALRQISHPTLMVTDRIWCFNNHIVLAMALAEGDLEDLLQVYLTERSGAMAPELVCHYLRQVAEGLDFLNARRHRIDSRLIAVQHCDIKPSNLLVFGNTVKIADFGLATMTSAPSQNHHRAGTMDYAAPEVFHGQVSDRTDQFSLAVTYCRLRGGRLPFAEVAAFQPSCLRDRGPADLSMLSPLERPIVARALAAAPYDRWPSSGEFISNLAVHCSSMVK